MARPPSRAELQCPDSRVGDIDPQLQPVDLGEEAVVLRRFLLASPEAENRAIAALINVSNTGRTEEFMQEKEDALPSRKPLDGRRILVVEDDDMLAALTHDFLENLGCPLVALASGTGEALLAVEKLEIQCPILDVNLKGDDGYCIAAELDAREIPFVFVKGCRDRTLPSPF